MRRKRINSNHYTRFDCLFLMMKIVMPLNIEWCIHDGCTRRETLVEVDRICSLYISTSKRNLRGKEKGEEKKNTARYFGRDVHEG